MPRILPDGWIHARGEAALDDTGKAVCIVGMALDITRRKQAEEELRLAHDPLRRFVESNIVGIIIASPADAVLEAHDYFLNLTGFTRQELELGKVDWRAITPPEWLPVDEQALRELREQGVSAPHEKEYLRRDGTRIPVLIAGAVLPGPGEQIAAFVLNIIERERAEQGATRE